MASFESIMKKFLESYEGLDEDVFSKEFMLLKSLSQKYKEDNRYPAVAGSLPVNRKKNRFKDILPFEYTRVELHPFEGIEGSDYINANYILGSDGEINYIAAQGPLPNTVSDFWRMLWYHNIEVVVMACREVEMGKNKCERYWPTIHQSIEIDSIKVSTTYEENISNDFVIRDFKAECQGETQVIRQYHYNAWPDHGKPNSPDPIIRMIEMMNDYRKHKEIPMVIHCSAGCGRTGTMIGIDIAKTMLQAEDVPPDFSVYKIVEKMRQQRPAMVQAKDQYVFVYMAIAELARRSIGISPTLPPKPANKSEIAPCGKSYINIDTNTPLAAGSRSSTPSSITSSSPPGSHLSAEPTYQNVNNQPPLPSHKRHSKSDIPDINPPIPSHKRHSRSDEIEDIKEAAKIPPAVAKRPNIPVAKQRGVTGGIVSEKKTKEDKMLPQPSPKPRARKSKRENDATPLSAPVPTATVTTRVTAPPVTTPSSVYNTNTLHSPLRSPVRSSTPDKPKPPVKSTTEDTELESVYSLAVGEETSSSKNSSSIMDTFMDILGEDLVNAIEKKDSAHTSPRKSPTRPLPSIPLEESQTFPPSSQDSLDQEEDVPPEIPQRTEARLELVAPTYEFPESSANGSPITSRDADYEEPTPLSIPVGPKSGTWKPNLPTSQASVSTSASTALPSRTNGSGSGLSLPAGVGSKFGSIFKKSKKEKKQSEDVNAHGSNSNSTVAKATQSGTGDAIKLSRPSSENSISSKDDKYKFPGTLGYGIRLERPSGPREEPLHWKVITHSVVVA